ncbi:MAG TPA: hypothetical protein VHR55_03075 [Candidatus Limnocylindria bacterium]|nr:hypothetical protein [Candidatus Limnocylindria bacterium]
MIGPGSVAETVQVGIPLAGLLATWDENGRMLWAIDDEAAVRDRISRGLVARAQVEPRRFREVGLLVRDAGVLVLPDRFSAGGDPGEPQVPGHGVQLRRVADDADQERADAAWTVLASWIGTTLFLASERGEFVVVERGGWDAPPEPYVLGILAGTGDERRWVLECAPAPAPPTLWPVNGSDLRGATASAPPDAETIRAGGHLAVDAARRWAATPHDLGLTFGTPAP